MKNKILVVEDDSSLIEGLQYSLSKNGFAVDIAHTVKEATELIENNRYDLLVLDVTLPDGNGFSICEQVRKNGNHVPIIFLTALDEEVNVIRGLDIGGDDYITKPFGLKELSARIAAHLRREQRAILQSESREKRHLAFPGLIIDLQSRECKVHGKPIALTKREFDILELLALHPGQVFSRDQIYEKIWGYDAEGDSATVAEHIKNIRSKFSKYAAGTEYISTVWGIGYRFNKDI